MKILDEKNCTVSFVIVPLYRPFPRVMWGTSSRSRSGNIFICQRMISASLSPSAVPTGATSILRSYVVVSTVIEVAQLITPGHAALLMTLHGGCCLRAGQSTDAFAAKKKRWLLIKWCQWWQRRRIKKTYPAFSLDKRKNAKSRKLLIYMYQPAIFQKMREVEINTLTTKSYMQGRTSQITDVTLCVRF